MSCWVCLLTVLLAPPTYRQICWFQQQKLFFSGNFIEINEIRIIIIIIIICHQMSDEQIMLGFGFSRLFGVITGCYGHQATSVSSAVLFNAIYSLLIRRLYMYTACFCTQLAMLYLHWERFNDTACCVIIKAFCFCQSLNERNDVRETPERRKTIWGGNVQPKVKGDTWDCRCRYSRS